MFYVACEMRDRPDLKTKPCAVGKKLKIKNKKLNQNIIFTLKIYKLLIYIFFYLTK
jgi:nucleotidyltransferase/DNA polymerase involved in DNA repair